MKSPQWFEKRFTESQAKIRCDCQLCGRPMWFPPSRAGKYLTCGAECAAARREKLKEERKRECLTCGGWFFARANRLAVGGGKYCCVACAEPTRASGRTPEARAKSGEARRAAIASGRYVPPRGADSPSWKGGLAAHRERRRASGAERESTRKYRQENPEKVREFTRKRRGLITGALPRGTVTRIGEAQRWKCAACRVSIKDKYHMDHILALASGGKHEPKNIQLLCPACNVRKSAKHPVDFMQERGFLL